MTDEPQVIDYLREQFARLHNRMDKSDARQDEMITRIGSLERHLAGMTVDVAAIQVRLDNMTRAIDRIERRLDLTESAA